MTITGLSKSVKMDGKSSVPLAIARLKYFTHVLRLEDLNLSSLCVSSCPVKWKKPPYSASQKLLQQLQRDMASVDPKTVEDAARCDSVAG